MASNSLPVYTLCMLLVCISSLQTVVMANGSPKCDCRLCFTVYRHEIRGGPNNTILLTVGTSPAAWGSYVVYDNMMKEGQSADSTLLGKITGSAVVTSKGGILAGGIQTVFQHNFGPGSVYNGSSLNIIGTAATQTPPWELIVPGGTGCFRGYSGFVLAQPIPSATVGPLVVSKWDFCLFQQFHFKKDFHCPM
ncbi:hypothetical protein M758_6G071700 [Ceratodon purpureus]|uniref:Dirigent protein n=1 Tax=Ceratodon purpureus TaxID=3225 RepID=A0A8T0HGM9_CERPU|nr:hypothetical protein KC19_6G076300 [Ceratodon purpureus]KAG0613039.1 hypothetical protein M758_6G071700 [Ceratodon purpureus]